jgi:formate dehydrogenase beta subunit
MPVLRTVQGHEEFEEATREGVIFHQQRGPKRFFGENGKLKGIEFIGVKRTYDGNGRFNPVFDESVTERFDVDTVILAIGQKADLSFIAPADRVEISTAGFIKVNPQTLETTAPGIFAGGDAAFGPRNIIDAVANGKKAALSIDEYFNTGTSGTGAGPETFFELFIDKIQTSRFTRAEDFEQHPREAPPTIDLKRRTGISEVETGYTEAQARTQAERCLSCHVQTIYDADKCVLCNRCVDICPEFCLKLVPLADLDLDEAMKAKLLGHYSVDPMSPASAMIKDDETCIRCGLCAVEVFYYEEHGRAGAKS